MNFLQICQRVRSKSGITGTTLTPTTVVGQTGELGRVVDWVNEAWEELQNMQTTWDWMRGDFSFATTAGTYAYAPTAAPISLTDFADWHRDTLRAYLTSSGLTDEQFITEWEYQRFRNYYEYGSVSQGRPVVFAVRASDKALLLGANPDAIYTVRGQYQKKASLMTLDADIPSLPTQYHMLLVHGALMKYAAYENAPEVMSTASRDYYNMLGRLNVDQLPQLVFGPPLA